LITRSRLCLITAPWLVVLLTGCGGDGQLAPVQGPLAAQRPPPIYKVTIDADSKMSAARTKADVCKGLWSNVAQGDSTAAAMSGEWDAVYGKDYFSAKVVGNATFSRAVLTCPDGTTLNIEFNSDKGVAKDGKGDVFKLTF
jgi:hypothetical protein